MAQQATVKEKVNAFIEKHQNYFNSVEPVSQEDLREAIRRMGTIDNCVTADALSDEYKEFLGVYGSIGTKFMLGDLVEASGEAKISHICRNQLEFKRRCLLQRMRKEEAKCCWQIGREDPWRVGRKSTEYYFNISETGNGYIYSYQPEIGHKLYAYTFMEFLERIFENYERRIISENYEDRILEFVRT